MSKTTKKPEGTSGTLTTNSKYTFATTFQDLNVDWDVLGDDFAFETTTELLKDKYLEYCKAAKTDAEKARTVKLITSVCIKGTIGRQESINIHMGEDLYLYTRDEAITAFKETGLITGYKPTATLGWFSGKFEQNVFRRLLSTKEGELKLRALVRRSNKLCQALIDAKIDGIQDATDNKMWIFKVFDHLTHSGMEAEYLNLCKVIKGYVLKGIAQENYVIYLTSCLVLISRIAVKKALTEGLTPKIMWYNGTEAVPLKLFGDIMTKYAVSELCGFTSKQAAKIADLYFTSDVGKALKDQIVEYVKTGPTQNQINAKKF